MCFFECVINVFVWCCDQARCVSFSVINVFVWGCD